MIRILNIISDTNIGGAGRALINYLRYADRSNFDISVILPRGSELIGNISSMDVKITEADGFADRSFSPAAMNELKRLINDYDPHIVHTHGSLTGRMAAKACGKKIVFTRHSAFPFPDYVTKTPLKAVYRFLYQHYSDRIIAVSPAGTEILLSIGIPENVTETIMNGVEPVRPISAAESAEVRKRCKAAEDDFLVGILARIEEYKGHDDILAAVRILRDEGKKVKLVIAGTGSYEDTVRKKVGELGLENDVTFAGFVQDVSPILGAMDVQLNASYVSETSSLSIIEGMSIGLPAIVSDYSGNPYLIDDGVSGLLFPPRSPEKLAEKIELIMDDADLYTKLKDGAADAYRRKFTGEIFASRIEEIYRKVLTE